ncbi:hypothetical protein OQA88_13338 [Cercophora sp. LCS_1]
MAGDLTTFFRLPKSKPKSRPQSTAPTLTATLDALSQTLPPPVSKTITAIRGLLTAGETLSNINSLSTTLNSHVPATAALLENFLPTMQIMATSLCDILPLLTQFQIAATTSSIGLNLILTYQGISALHLIASKLENIHATLAAQTALLAQKDFASYVHDMLRERIGQTQSDTAVEHWFFIWHPDDDWYPRFYHLLEEKPVGPQFCGYTNQIDTVFVFMVAARRYCNEKGKKVRMHLLVPAYQPVLVAEALKIPEEIGDFVMEGRRNSDRELVWLHLPEEQMRRYTQGIGRWAPEPGNWWEGVLGIIGWGKKGVTLGAPRTLGCRQDGEDAKGLVEDVEREGAKLLEIEKEGALVKVDERERRGEERRRATPLHQRSKREGRRRRRSAERDKGSTVSRRGNRSSSVGY